MKSRSFSPQAGLTLLEMVIGLSVIVLVLVLAIASFDQNSGRAQSLEAKMQLVRAGVLRFQTDLPCGPAKLSALTRREDAAVGLCGDSNDLNNWRGPYIDSGSTYVNDGDSDISNILSGASLAITQKVVNGTIYTILKVSEISDEMRSAMVALCSDDCTPYKNIDGNTETIGILVSRLSFQASNQGGDLVAFGVTPAVPAGPVVLLPAIQPPPFVPPVITLPSSTIASYAGPTALLAMAPTPTPPPPMPQQLPLPPPPPPPPPPPQPSCPYRAGLSAGTFYYSLAALFAPLTINGTTYMTSNDFVVDIYTPVKGWCYYKRSPPPPGINASLNQGEFGSYSNANINNLSVNGGSSASVTNSVISSLTLTRGSSFRGTNVVIETATLSAGSAITGSNLTINRVYLNGGSGMMLQGSVVISVSKDTGPVTIIPIVNASGSWLYYY